MVEVRKYLLCVLLFACVPAQATFTLQHVVGRAEATAETPAGTLKEGQQIVHTDSIVVYANQGDSILLSRPDHKAFRTYLRWYNYDTDGGAEHIVGTSNSFTKNNRGWFQLNPWEGAEKLAVKYEMQNAVYRIALDQSAYADYSGEIGSESSNKTFTEPTLSKRLIYVMRPASEMAARMDTCTGDKWLEIHEMMAPVGRQLYIGPDYVITNYHYNESSPEQMNVDANWQWSVVGGSTTQPTFTSYQYVAVSSSTPGTVTYTLQYTAGETTYNVAKFHVTYMAANEVGPHASLPAPTNRMDLIYEQTFNYNRPGRSDTLIYYTAKHLPVEESSYGCYYPDIAFAGGASRPGSGKTDLTSGEYGICNMQDKGSTFTLFNHVDGSTNAAANAAEGYFLYVDGSDRQGEVFSLEVDADLCPGSTMYFSAWLIDGTNWYGSAPNMDFVVIGEDADGTEHILTTFTTGEFGCQAVDIVGNSTKMKNDTWYQIMFPIRFEATNIYPRYELKIYNKASSVNGNDFAIDDIRIYVQKPPVMPIQASTSGCVDKQIDTIRAYFRIDYQTMEYEDGGSGTLPLYFQWRDANDTILHTHYYNKDSADNVSNTFGCLSVKLNESDITAADTCLSLLSFDSKFKETHTTEWRYIKETIDNTTERYVLYIALPIEVRPNYTYTGFVTLQSGSLGKRENQCGNYADLLVAGGTRITINDEVTYGEIVGICGHRSYTLNIVLTQIVQDVSSGELVLDTTHCKADWLVGDSAYVNAHPEVYLHTFSEIHDILGFYNQDVSSSDVTDAVNYLLRQGLLTLDTAGISMTAEQSLSYTAFPHGEVNGKLVCAQPRFLNITPAVPASNMMVVGNPTETEESLPDIVKDRPRVVRISNAQKETGIFGLRLYLKGDENEVYEIDSVYMISSTHPHQESIKLTPDHTTMLAQDTLTLTGAELKTLEAGYDYTFHVAFAGENDEDKCDRGYTYFTIRIVPDVVVWQGGDWNTDAGWSSFLPTDTTDVVLISGGNYNISFQESPTESYDFNYTRNKCRNIYIPVGATIAGQENLDITGIAYVDIPAPAAEWALTAIPIQGIVSGDLFAHQAESEEAFTVAAIRQDVGDDAHDRYTYEVYQRPFIDGSWIVPTNDLDRPITPGEALWVGFDYAEGAADPVIRFPKPDNSYRYYSSTTAQWLGDEAVTITRPENYGKPAYDADHTSVTMKETVSGIYMLGNPTFGYIDITALVGAHTDILTGEYSSDPFSDNMTNASAADPHILLPPYKGVLLKAQSGVSGDQTITITTVPAPETSASSPARGIAIRPSKNIELPAGSVATGAKNSSTPQISETDYTIASFFEALNGSTVSTLIIDRTLVKNGYFNTLCLPFDLATLEGTDLAGGELFAFTGATKNDGVLDCEITTTTSIEAGKPYLIRWASGENITRLTFNNVEIKDAMGESVGTGTQFIGFVPRTHIDDDANHSSLFLGQNNTLYWPSTGDTGYMKGFRAYFSVPTAGQEEVASQGTPARLVIRSNITTPINKVGEMPNCTKMMKNGCLYILRGQHIYNAQGVILK